MNDQVGSSKQRQDLRSSQDEMELAQLMRRSQAGDAASYALLLARVQKFSESYVSHSFARLGLLASGGHDDVVQEILLGIHSKRASFDSEQFFLPWMYAIARYKIIDHLRRTRNALKSLVSLDDELENIEVMITYDFGSELDMNSLLAKLPEKQKEVLKLVKIDGLSIKETCDRTGLSVSDVKVTIHRALKVLKRKVEAQNDAD